MSTFPRFATPRSSTSLYLCHFSTNVTVLLLRCCINPGFNQPFELFLTRHSYRQTSVCFSLVNMSVSLFYRVPTNEPKMSRRKNFFLPYISFLSYLQTVLNSEAKVIFLQKEDNVTLLPKLLLWWLSITLKIKSTVRTMAHKALHSLVWTATHPQPRQSLLLALSSGHFT